MFLIETGLRGKLWIMPCPRRANLFADVASYRAAGADRIVSMLGKDEAEALGLSSERSVCEAAGISFHNMPIVDFGLPEPAIFDALVDQIKGWLEAGQSTAVHCRAGIGRSGMVTAGVVIATGRAANVAVQHVTTARGVSIPDTVEQGRFLAAYSNRQFEKMT